MAVTKAPQFKSFEDYLAADPSDLRKDILKKRATIPRKMPPPRLVVEVVSPGGEESDHYQRDYVQKPRQYAAIAVPEYWIIDPERTWVKVGTLSDGTYQFQTFKDDGLIQSPTFPDLTLNTAQVLRGGP